MIAQKIKKNINASTKKNVIFYVENLDYCLNSYEESGGKFKYNFWSKECIANCGTKYERNNICYDSDSYNFIQEVGRINKCLFTYNAEDGFISPDIRTSKKCYISCSDYNTGSHKYFNHGANICMEKCSKIGNSKIYRKDGRFECFSSCKDIDNGTFIYGNKDNSGDFICNSFDSFKSSYIDPNDNNYYITKGVV